MLFTAHSKPADIVKAYPKAGDLFIKHNIYFCCEGDEPLAEQFTKVGQDVEAFLLQLNADYIMWKNAGNRAKNWDTVPLDELVDHILNHHHAYLKEELPILGEYITKIRNVHGYEHPDLFDLHRLYNELKLEMTELTVKEDMEYFPLIIEYVNNPTEQRLHKIKQIYANLEEGHELAADLIKKIREMTDGFQVPEDACQLYRLTFDRLAELVKNVLYHVHLEKYVLYERLN